jgi:structural maintenance of chromosome 2
LKTIEKKDAKLQEITKVLAEDINPTLERLRAERSHYLKWTSNNGEIERLEKFCAAYQYYSALERQQTIQEQHSQLSNERDSLDRDHERIKGELIQIETRAKKLEGDRDKKMKSEFAHLDEKLSDLSKQVVKHNSVYANTVQSLKDAKDAHKATQQTKHEVGNYFYFCNT